MPINMPVYRKEGANFQKIPFEALKKGDLVRFGSHQTHVFRIMSNIIGNVRRHRTEKRVHVRRARYI